MSSCRLTILVIISTASVAQAQAPDPTDATSASPTTASAAATAPPAVKARLDALVGLNATAKPVVEEAGAKVDVIAEADKLRTPDSPAFVLLGVAPTQIQKPTTPRDLAVALSAVVSDDAELRIPENLAIEVAPYWLLVGPRVTYERASSGGPIEAWRNLSFSLASTEVAEDGSRRLGFGFRTSIAAGGEPGCGTALNESLDTQLVALSKATAIGDTEVKRMKKEATDARGRIDTDAFDAQAQLVKQQVVEASELAMKAEKLIEKCAEAATARPRALSLAGAVAWRFPTESVGDGDLVLQSYWLTYSHTLGSWTLLAVGRAQLEEARVGWDAYADLGGRAVVARDTYAASIELVGRKQFHGEFADDAALLVRAAAQAEYMIKDGTWLTITFGKEFEAAAAGSLFSIANLTTSFGAPTIARPTKK